MHPFSIAGMLALCLVIYFTETKHVKSVKVKATVASILFAGFVVGILVMFFPGTPNPSDLVHLVFKPLDVMVGTE